MRKVILLLMFFAVNVSAHESCDEGSLSISNIGSVVLNLGAGTTTNYSVTCLNSNTCPFYVAFSGGNNNLSYNPRRLRLGSTNNFVDYNIYDSVSNLMVLKDSGNANASEVQSGSFNNQPSSYSINKSFYVKAFDYIDRVVAPGIYTDVVQVSLFGESQTPPSGRRIRQQSVPISLVYPPATRISLVPTGGPYVDSSSTQSLNFGNLVTGSVLNFDLLTVSNQSFQVKFSSAKNGALTHATAPNSKVNYTLTANNIPVNLVGSSSNPVTVVSGVGCCTPMGGQRTPIRVTIGNVSNQLAGSYGDIITVTIVSP